MKAFQLNLTEVVALIFCASIGIRIVSGIPGKFTASDGREYLIETEYKYNWFEAFHKCARRDSQLVVIDSEEKNTAIVNLLKEVIGESRNLWLGGNDAHSLGKERTFFWATTGQKFTFTYWGYGEPNNYKNQEHCVHIDFSKPLYQWNDNECSKKMGFICEDNYDVDTRNIYNTVDKFNSDVFLKFERLQKDNINELNTRLETLEEMAKEVKSDTQKLQSISESYAQKLVDQQELTAKNLREKLQKQDNELNEQIKQSIEQITADFDEELQKVNINELNTRLETLEQMAKEGKSETQKLQSINESSVQKLVDQQELTAKNLWEKLQKQDNELYEQIKQSIEQITADFDEELQKVNINELNTRLETLEQMAKEGKSETQKLQSINESSVQKLVDQQELTAKNLWEKMQKQDNELNEQIKQSMEQINAKFDEKLNASSIASPYPYRNVVVIKQ